MEGKGGKARVAMGEDLFRAYKAELLDVYNRCVAGCGRGSGNGCSVGLHRQRLGGCDATSHAAARSSSSSLTLGSAIKGGTVQLPKRQQEAVYSA